MAKSLSRDIQVLAYILQNQLKIKDVAKRFECDFSVNGSRSVVRDSMAFDLCAMYMAQIGENVKLLTDETREELDKSMNTSVLKYFRNMIDHAYEKVNKSMLVVYIQNTQSEQAVKAVKTLIKNCTEKKSGGT